MRRVAAAVCAVALVPITLGSFVTTLKAGMAFADWPSSDGHNMLLYPWLRDLRHTDKFVEHGHRLAGVLIGLLSILLVVVAWRYEKRRWIRFYSLGILVAVIAQGLLGGARVLMNRQTLAMLHSMTGALFFTFCLMLMVLTSRFWQSLRTQRDTRITTVSWATLMILPLAVGGQYCLGSAFRHLHTMLHEHIAGAVIVTVLAVSASVSLWRSDSKSLRRCGQLLACSLGFQIFLGLGSYVTRLGYPDLGYVATSGSLSQSIVCSLHTVGGMFLLGSSVICSSAVYVLHRDGRLDGMKMMPNLTAVPYRRLDELRSPSLMAGAPVNSSERGAV